MPRPIDALLPLEPAPRLVQGPARAAVGTGERAAAVSLEQRAVAIHQPAVVLLGELGADVADPHTLSSSAYTDAARHQRERASSLLSARNPAPEVEVDAAPVPGDPEATLQKLLQIRQAALSPPATRADLDVAADAARKISEAKIEMANRRYRAEAPRDRDEAEQPQEARKSRHPAAVVRSEVASPSADSKASELHPVAPPSMKESRAEPALTEAPRPDVQPVQHDATPSLSPAAATVAEETKAPPPSARASIPPGPPPGPGPGTATDLVA